MISKDPKNKLHQHKRAGIFRWTLVFSVYFWNNTNENDIKLKWLVISPVQLTSAMVSRQLLLIATPTNRAIGRDQTNLSHPQQRQRA